MTTFYAWLPFAICVASAILYLLARWKKVLKKISRYFLLDGAIVFVVVAIIVSVAFSFFDGAKPDPDWKSKVGRTNTAIIFGFGYDSDGEGGMLPGTSNQALYDEAISNPGFQNLIMQEGVMAAARNDIIHSKGKNLIRMHPLDLGYVNTLVAAKYSIMKMDSLGVKSAVVYAHDLQLARAVYDLKRIAASDPRWGDIEFITPNINKTPFPKNSAQRHTRWKCIYLPIELFISRPLNTFLPL